MTIASLLIVAGSVGRWRPGLVIAGLGIAVAVCAMAAYLALGRRGGPRPPTVWLGVGGLVLFYVLVAAAAGLAGTEYAIAGLVAGVIPLAALCLLLATMRRKTVEAGGQLRDASGDADEDPYPGIGFDSTTPLGDTPEHSDAVDRH
jgi:drug/metabolite transporter (DMT)-like permease